MASQKIRLRIHGDKELAAKLRQLGISTSQVLEAAVTAAAVVIEDAAESMAPGPHIDHATTKREPQPGDGAGRAGQGALVLSFCGVRRGATCESRAGWPLRGRAGRLWWRACSIRGERRRRSCGRRRLSGGAGKGGDG